MKTFKLFRTLKSQPGKIFPLFIGNTTPVPFGQWVPAEDIPTKGFAHRPGWHSGIAPCAPHLRTKDNLVAASRVWCETEVPDDGYYRYPVPKGQGLGWIISDSIKVVRVLDRDAIFEALWDNLPPSVHWTRLDCFKEASREAPRGQILDFFESNT